ncbi:Tat pathway signal sequence protein [Rutstroemia sp. NJR-2017a BBW]|nr:Tat pathway signal sequence protein [Rutstroemia sp. NJR-2017a BBW]
MGPRSENVCLLNEEQNTELKYNQEFDTNDVPTRRTYLRTTTISGFLAIALILSLSLNVAFFLRLSSTIDRAQNLGSTKYANLKQDHSRPYVGYSEYSGSNFTRTDELWNAVDYNAGLVALPNDWTKSKGLPKSSMFPWDKEKSIWLLNGHHNLHCVKRIYLSLKEYRDGLPQSLPPQHIYHCLDSLRDQIICDADDTPRFTLSANEQGHFTGLHQERQCRDWNKLEAWAKENTACYRYGDPSWNDKSQYERVKFCPDDSPYLPIIREFFGKGDDWYPTHD